MRFVIHFLETKNPFGRDREAERRGRNLSDFLMKHDTFVGDFETKTLDYYNDDDMQHFRKELMTKDAGLFHVVFPGGQCAQENLEMALKDMALTNTFIVYNSHCDVLERKEIQYGNIAPTLHYDIGVSLQHSALPIAQMDMVDSLHTLLMGLAVEKYKQFPLYSNRLGSVEGKQNFKERETQRESKAETITRAQLELPEKIKQAIKAYQNVEKQKGRFFDNNNSTSNAGSSSHSDILQPS